MKISDFAPAGKTSAAGKKKGVSSSASAGGFMGMLSLGESDAAAPAAPAGDIQPIAMDGLLSLQEMPDDEVKKRRAVADGKGALDALETLRMALLSGNVPERLLHSLNNVVAVQKQHVNDPQLMRIIEDIQLRAAVELAKLERAAKSS